MQTDSHKPDSPVLDLTNWASLTRQRRIPGGPSADPPTRHRQVGAADQIGLKLVGAADNRRRAGRQLLADGCACAGGTLSRSLSCSSQRLWCSLAQLRSTVPLPIASNAPSMPIVPI